MASPWKFLARLVSPRRLEKQDGSAIEEGKPDVLAIAGPTEAVVEESLHIVDQPASEPPRPVDRSDATSAEPEQSDDTRSDLQDVAGQKLGPTFDPILPDVGVSPADAAPEIEAIAAAVPAMRRTRVKKVEAVAVVSQILPATPSVTDEIMSLDEEIAALRARLASKLRLQNAQLKKMLERFER